MPPNGGGLGLAELKLIIQVSVTLVKGVCFEIRRIWRQRSDGFTGLRETVLRRRSTEVQRKTR